MGGAMSWLSDKKDDLKDWGRSYLNPIDFAQDTFNAGADRAGEIAGDVLSGLTGADDLKKQNEQLLKQQRRSNRRLERRMRDEKKRQRKELADAEANAMMATENAKRRRALQQKRNEYTGRSSTILTTPLGLGDDFEGQRRTLLGVG